MNKATFWRSRLGLLLALVLVATTLPGITALAQDDDLMMIFMHHSTGRRLIEEGLLKEGLAEYNIALWDHGYNGDGLVTPEWDWLGTNWDIPGDNTDPDGWVEVFNQPVTSPPTNAFSHMLEYDVIAFKSCYPNAHIADDEMLETYKAYYLEIREIMDQHPDKLFIPFTNPPLVPNETSPDAAARAIEWAAFLNSAEYLEGHPNVVTFDFFSLLADEEGYLRAEYRVDEWDSHPNRLANETIGPLLIEFVTQAVEDFIPGEALITPEQVQPAAETASDSVDGGQLLSASFPQWEQVRTFGEECANTMWDWAGNGTLSWEMVHPQDPFTDALQVTYDLAMDDYGGLGFHFAPNPEWVTEEGIAFSWRADQPGLELTFSLGVQDPTDLQADESDATPFEYRVYTSDSAEWQEIMIPWSSFTKARWWGDAGVNVFDPANVIWVSFGLGNAAQAQAGTIWIADLHIITAE